MTAHSLYAGTLTGRWYRRNAMTRRSVRGAILVAMDVGVPELLIILAVVLLVFGSKKVPELARSLGRATKEFKRGQQDDEDAKPDASPG
jgi:sec-independent protein translocase protein TatA